MLSQQSLPENILRILAEQNTEKVKLAVTDIDGVLRGKMISFEKFIAIVENSAELPL